jgi:hypothetical protein
MMKMIIIDEDSKERMPLGTSWTNMVHGKSKYKIDLSTLIAYLLMLAYSEDPEDKAAFEMIMFNTSLAMQCEGTVTLRTKRLQVLRDANSELAGLLVRASQNDEHDSDEFNVQIKST